MEYYLIVSTIAIFAGIYRLFARRGTLAILISVELMLSAINVNFVVFNRSLSPEGMKGHFFALFSIAISAVGTTVTIAVMISIYRNLRGVQICSLSDLKWQRQSGTTQFPFGWMS